MKTRLTAIALVGMMIFGLGACGGGKEKKSSGNDIATFKVGEVEYEINQSTRQITHHYPKTSADTWTALPSGWPNLTATVVLKDPKATISPNPSTPQNYQTGGSFTVTAEDGTEKKYTVKASRDETL